MTQEASRRWGDLGLSFFLTIFVSLHFSSRWVFPGGYPLQLRLQGSLCAVLCKKCAPGVAFSSLSKSLNALASASSSILARRCSAVSLGNSGSPSSTLAPETSSGAPHPGLFAFGQFPLNPNGSTHPVGFRVYWYEFNPPASFSGSGVRYRPRSGW